MPGFCKSTKLDAIVKHDYVLTPGRYVGAADIEEDDEPFAEKMARLTAELKGQFQKNKTLEETIKKTLRTIGYDL